MDANESGLPTSENSADSAEQPVADEVDGITPTGSYHTLPVVGLGGSAGSLKALKEFFEHSPVDSGMAYVVVTHLAPEHESGMPEILQRCTSMPVSPLLSTAKLEADHVYVISPGKHISMMDGSITVRPMPNERGRRTAVDFFFRTLADVHGPHAMAIVLSGADSDGAIGIKRVKERGGLTVAQDPGEAETNEMPRAAIATGMVDWVLRVQQMPARLLEYRRNEKKIRLPAEKTEEAQAPSGETNPEKSYREILTFLRLRTGRDFMPYKRATILRRIARRMQVNGIEDLVAYEKFLRTNAGEAGALLQDLLISVTNFFRDAEAFRALEAAIPSLFVDKDADDTVRVWVPACATGEEAFSLGMLLTEYAHKLPSPPQIQIFATDVDQDAIAAARSGFYPDTIIADVSEERIRRFFVKRPGGYRVGQQLRELVLFALHDVLKDAPFSRVDLITCRNLLIYLKREAQHRAFDIFHFALREEGLMMLGLSETAEDAPDRFGVMDKKARIYRRRGFHRGAIRVPTGGLALITAPRLPSNGLASNTSNEARNEIPGLTLPEPAQKISPAELHFKLLERLGPPSVIVNAESDIIHISPSAKRFLQIAAGSPTANLFQLVHPMLRVELRTCLFKAMQSGEKAQAIKIPVELADGMREVDVTVEPAPDLAQGYLVIFFVEHQAKHAPEVVRPPEAEGLVRSLEHELEILKQQLRDTVEQHVADTEEMKASNEELQAMNEELRSVTEELETSREELQSINEELTTINTELKAKVEELGRANGDLQNLIASTNIPTVFLDGDLRIKRYTPDCASIFNFIPGDIGRPLAHVTHELEYDSLVHDAQKVLVQPDLIEREVRSKDRRYFLARLQPYHATDGRTVGVVLTFIDITDRRKAQQEVERATNEMEGLVETRTAELSQLNVVLREEISERKRTEAARLDLQRRIVDAQEKERGRISRELHDEIGQHLTALSLGLRSIETGSAPPDTIPKLLHLTEIIGHEIHEVALALRPTSLDDLGLVRALQHFVTEWSSRTHVEAEFHSTGLESRRLPAEVETTLYRIVGEALNNVAKHAQAKNVSVLLEPRGDDVIAIVEDDGVGFSLEGSEPKSRSIHLGLIGMHERAALLNGEVTIETSPGQGTTVFVRLPISSFQNGKP